MYRIKFKPFGERTYLVMVLFRIRDRGGNPEEVGYPAGWVTRTSNGKDGKWIIVPAHRDVRIKGTAPTRALATDRLVAAMAQPIVNRSRKRLRDTAKAHRGSTGRMTVLPLDRV